MSRRVFIGVGSNIGDGVRHCCDSIRSTLRDDRARLLAVSSLYTTSPVSPVLQDDFVNGAFSILWESTAQELLLLLNRIEHEMGRVRDIPLGPRTIDLDILLFGAEVVSTPSLTIPHPGLLLRRFALVPCLEIDPSLLLPPDMKPLESFLNRIDPSQEISPPITCLPCDEPPSIFPCIGWAPACRGA